MWGTRGPKERHTSILPAFETTQNAPWSLSPASATCVLDVSGTFWAAIAKQSAPNAQCADIPSTFVFSLLLVIEHLAGVSLVCCGGTLAAHGMSPSGDCWRSLHFPTLKISIARIQEGERRRCVLVVHALNFHPLELRRSAIALLCCTMVAMSPGENPKTTSG